MPEVTQSPDPSRALVFIIHGLRGSRQKLADLERLAQECYPNGYVHAPVFDHASLLSRTKASEVVLQIISKIDVAYAHGIYDKVVIIGHSMGAVLARRAIAEARGLPTHWNEDLTTDHERLAKTEPGFDTLTPRPWAAKVDLFVMMASISRGWSVQNTKSPVQSFQWALGGMIGHLLPARWRPTIFDFRQGSPFIVQTRLRWLEYCDRYGQDRPRVVQFLGTADDMAPPNDTIDFATDADGKLFSQIELPHSTHSSVIQLEGKLGQSDRDRDRAANRRKIVKAMLIGDVAGYQERIVLRKYVTDELPPDPDDKVENLVFVVHGIRDRGYWTKKIAARIKQRAEKAGTNFVSRTPSYGYFPILPFLLPWVRRQKVEWLMDHYVEAAATYPRADLHFMGHSNGTYLGAWALMDYPMVSFKRIMFAGSVVRTDFPWGRFVRAKRVEKIFNIVATADLVVAVFPNGLRRLQSIFDLGGAGHDGFSEQSVPNALYQMDLPAGQLADREYIEGGHSTAREENIWTDIAEFFVTGEVIPSGAGNPHFVSQQPLLSRVLGRFAPGIVAIIACFVIGAGVLSVTFLAAAMADLTPPGWLAADGFFQSWSNLSIGGQLCVFGAYLFLLRFMALRF